MHDRVHPDRIGSIVAALTAARSVAILRLGGIGDVIETVPVAWSLRERLGAGVRLAWLAHPESAPLLAALPPLDEVVAIPRASAPRALSRWRAALAGHRFDVVLDLHGNLKSGAIARLSGAPVRVGFDRADCRESLNALFTTHRLPRLASTNKTRRALEVGQLLGGSGRSNGTPRFDYSFPAAARARAEKVLANVDRSRPVALLQLGRRGDVRSWPVARVADLARELARRGRHVVVTGGPTELPAADDLRLALGQEPGGAPAATFEVGTLALDEIGALFQQLAAEPGRAGVFVGPDGGALHLAAACGLRVVGLFGAQDPERTAPIGERVVVIHRRDAAPCVPCSRRECTNDEPLVCMTSIAAAEVADAVDARPRPRASAPPPAPAPSHAGRFSLVASAALVVMSVVPLLLALRRAPRWSVIHTDAAAAGVLVLVTGAIARRLGGARAGLFAGACVLLMSGYAWPVERSAIDVIAAACVTTSVFLYVVARGEEGRGARLRPGLPAAAFAIGVSAFIGGLVGLLLPLAILVVFELGERSPRRLLAPRFAIPVALFGALAVGAHSLEFGSSLLHGHVTSWAACVHFILIGLLPASIVVPFALFDHLKSRRYREDLGLADRAWRMPKAALLAALLLLLVPTFRGTTEALLGPLLALLIGSSLAHHWPPRRRRTPRS